jgi:formylglycine-generating enzyme required for sulfatase activity
MINSIGMKLRPIPAGEFLMGSPDPDKEARSDEKPQHRVRLTQSYYLGAHQITRGQFRQCVEATHYQTCAEKSW